jgi:HSP20 family protein
VDIYETPDALMLLADMPGVSRENLDVRVNEDLLTIQGKPMDAVPGDPIYREFDLTSFFRQFEIGEEIDREKIDADLKYGVLTLRLPKTEKSKPKRIDVKVS